MGRGDARIGTTWLMALLGFDRSGGGERVTLSQSSSSHATSVTGADWPHVVAWDGLPAGNCAMPPFPAGFSGISLPRLSRRPSPGPISSTTIFSYVFSITLYLCLCSIAVTVTALHPPRLCRIAVLSLKPTSSQVKHHHHQTHLSLIIRCAASATYSHLPVN